MKDRDRYQSAIERIDEMLNRRHEEGLGPGLALALTTRDELLATRTYGVSNADSGESVSDETIFRIALGVLVAAMYVPRKLFEQRMRVISAHGLDRDEDSRRTLAWQSLLLGISLWATIIDLAKPAWTTWASFPLPNWLRWLGAGLGALGTALLLWTHRALGDNFFGGCDVPAGNDFVGVSGGFGHSVALKSDGSLVAWGSNSSGQCDIPAGNDFVAVAAGYYHNVALKSDGALVAWGSND